MTTELSESDVIELTRLITEFAWMVDHGQADHLPELLGGEVEVTLGGPTMRGIDAVGAWGKERAQAEHVTRHILTNMRFVADGKDRARGTTMLTIYSHRGEGMGPADPASVWEYTDGFVRIDGRWRLEVRTVTQIFGRQDG